jgi:ribosomal protein S18 acetylase RimI-like enzyme
LRRNTTSTTGIVDTSDIFFIQEIYRRMPSQWRVMTDVGDDEALAVLAHDRVGNCFAIADLAPPMRAYSQYAVAYKADVPPATCVVVRHPAFNVVIAGGAEEGVAVILAQLDLPDGCQVQVMANHIPAIQEYYRFPESLREVLRMAVTADSLLASNNTPDRPVEQLTIDDLPKLRDLYALYPENHFRQDALEHGTFFGVRDGARIVTAGGTHVVTATYDIAVLGNIFTRPDERRKGYAAAITTALARELMAQGCRDVVLNVTATNDPAIRMYLQLGFHIHAHYWTGRGERLD